jgi:hypothetical protein
LTSKAGIAISTWLAGLRQQVLLFLGEVLIHYAQTRSCYERQTYFTGDIDNWRERLRYAGLVIRAPTLSRSKSTTRSMVFVAQVWSFNWLVDSYGRTAVARSAAVLVALLDMFSYLQRQRLCKMWLRYPCHLSRYAAILLNQL